MPRVSVMPQIDEQPADWHRSKVSLFRCWQPTGSARDALLLKFTVLGEASAQLSAEAKEQFAPVSIPPEPLGVDPREVSPPLDELRGGRPSPRQRAQLGEG